MVWETDDFGCWIHRLMVRAYWSMLYPRKIGTMIG